MSALIRLLFSLIVIVAIGLTAVHFAEQAAQRAQQVERVPVVSPLTSSVSRVPARVALASFISPRWRLNRVRGPQGEVRCMLFGAQNSREFGLLYGPDMEGVVMLASSPEWSVPQDYMARMTFSLDGVAGWGILGARVEGGKAVSAALPSEQIRFILGNLSLARSMTIDIPDGNARRAADAAPEAPDTVVLHNALPPQNFSLGMDGAAVAIDDWVECVKAQPDAERAVWLDSHQAQRANLPPDGSFSRWRSYVDQASNGRRMCSSVAEAGGQRAVRIALMPDRSVVLHLIAPDWAPSFEENHPFEVFFAFGDDAARVYRAQRAGGYVSVFLAAGDTSAGRAPDIAADNFLRELVRAGGFTVGFSAVLQRAPWHVVAPGTGQAAEWLRHCLAEGERH